MRRLLSSSALGAALAMAACAPAKEQPATEELAASYQRTIEEWFAAFNAGDAARLADLYAADAVRLPPGQPAVKGRQAILSAFEQEFGAFSSRRAEGGSEVVEFAGDWAMERGWYTFKGTLREAGREVGESGKYVVVARRRADGAWTIVWEIWNSDQ